MIALVSDVLAEMIRENGIEKGNIKSLLFSVTDDLPGSYSDEVMAVAGLDEVPAFSIQQFRYLAEMDHCMQIVLYTDREIAEPHHVLRGCSTWGKEWNSL